VDPKINSPNGAIYFRVHPMISSLKHSTIPDTEYWSKLGREMIDLSEIIKEIKERSEK
jgi:hypothetical protein